MQPFTDRHHLRRLPRRLSPGTVVLAQPVSQHCKVVGAHGAAGTVDGSQGAPAPVLVQCDALPTPRVGLHVHVKSSLAKHRGDWVAHDQSQQAIKRFSTGSQTYSHHSSGSTRTSRGGLPASAVGYDFTNKSPGGDTFFYAMMAVFVPGMCYYMYTLHQSMATGTSSEMREAGYDAIGVPAAGAEPVKSVSAALEPAQPTEDVSTMEML